MATFWGRKSGEEGHEWEICRFTKLCLYITFTEVKNFKSIREKNGKKIKPLRSSIPELNSWLHNLLAMCYFIMKLNIITSQFSFLPNADDSSFISSHTVRPEATMTKSRTEPGSPSPVRAMCLSPFSSAQSFWEWIFKKCLYVVVRSLSRVWFFATPWTAARQASLSFTISQSLFKPMSIESAMPSNCLILCCPLLLLPSV